MGRMQTQSQNHTTSISTSENSPSGFQCCYICVNIQSVAQNIANNDILCRKVVTSNSACLQYMCKRLSASNHEGYNDLYLLYCV